MNIKIKISEFGIGFHKLIFVLCIISYSSGKLIELFYGLLFLETILLLMTSKNLDNLRKSVFDFRYILAIYLMIILVSVIINSGVTKNIRYYLSLFYIPLAIIDAALFRIRYGYIGSLKFKNFFINISIIAALYGILEFIIQRNPLVVFFETDYLSGTVPYRAASFFKHPIIFAIILGVAISLIIEERKIIVKSLLVVAILMTRSRSTMLGILFVFILWLLKHIRFKINLKTFVVFISILVFLISPIGNEIIGGIINRFSDSLTSISGTQRLGTIYYFLTYTFNVTNIKNLIMLLVGHGSGAANVLLKMHTIDIPGFDTTDNQYITILYDYGVLILLMTFFGIGKCVHTFLKSYNKAVKENTIAIIFMAIVSFFCQSLENKIIVFLLAYAIIESSYNIKKTEI